MNPSTSFQRGDRVSATNTLFKMNGTVERLQAFTGLVRVRWDSRPGLFGSTVAAFSEWVHPSHLALLSREVSQATFSKGDVVEITRPHPSLEYQGALGVVVNVLTDRPHHVPRIQVKPYKPSKPFEKLSNGPFTYSVRELAHRRANGLVPVNFVREALGLKPASVDVRGIAATRPDPSKWTQVGTTDDGAGVFFATGGTLPPKVADIVDVKGTPRGLEATFQVTNEFPHFLKMLEQPTSIRISPAMRRRGITTEDAVEGLVQRAESAEHESRRQRSRADFTKRLLNESREGRERADSLARDLADEKDDLKRVLDRTRQAVESLTRRGNEYDVTDLQDRLHRAHVSRQQAENRAELLGIEVTSLKHQLGQAQKAAVFNSEATVAEADRLRTEVRDLKNQLGAAMNRSRRRGEAIERVQAVIRGL